MLDFEVMSSFIPNAKMYVSYLTTTVMSATSSCSSGIPRPRSANRHRYEGVRPARQSVTAPSTSQRPEALKHSVCPTGTFCGHATAVQNNIWEEPIIWTRMLVEWTGSLLAHWTARISRHGEGITCARHRW
uniref:(northern house mosquito) hypothetical protein n=1 Tax=Culex pipiens TaxID=7175 RepID=A0A8D8BY60_CULPI